MAYQKLLNILLFKKVYLYLLHLTQSLIFLISYIHKSFKKDLYIEQFSLKSIFFRGCLRVFHGLNFVTKKTPWYPEKLLDEKYARDMGKN